MKYNKFFLSGSVIAAAMTLGSCVGDLDLTPTDPSQLTPDQFASDPSGFLDKSIGGVYLQYATYGANGDASVQGFDGGMSTFHVVAVADCLHELVAHRDIDIQTRVRTHDNCI